MSSGLIGVFFSAQEPVIFPEGRTIVDFPSIIFAHCKIEVEPLELVPCLDSIVALGQSFVDLIVPIYLIHNVLAAFHVLDSSKCSGRVAELSTQMNHRQLALLPPQRVPCPLSAELYAECKL
jgi:hypothetical protein